MEAALSTSFHPADETSKHANTAVSEVNIRFTQSELPRKVYRVKRNPPSRGRELFDPCELIYMADLERQQSATISPVNEHRADSKTSSHADQLLQDRLTNLNQAVPPYESKHEEPPPFDDSHDALGLSTLTSASTSSYAKYVLHLVDGPDLRLIDTDGFRSPYLMYIPSSHGDDYCVRLSTEPRKGSYLPFIHLFASSDPIVSDEHLVLLTPFNDRGPPYPGGRYSRTEFPANWRASHVRLVHDLADEFVKCVHRQECVCITENMSRAGLAVWEMFQRRDIVGLSQGRFVIYFDKVNFPDIGFLSMLAIFLQFSKERRRDEHDFEHFEHCAYRIRSAVRFFRSVAGLDH